MGSVFIRPRFHSFSIREGERFRPGKNNRSDAVAIFNPLDSVAAVAFRLIIAGKKCLSVQEFNH